MLFGRDVLCEFVILVVGFGAWVRWHLFSSVVFGLLFVVGRRVCVTLVWVLACGGCFIVCECTYAWASSFECWM